MKNVKITVMRKAWYDDLIEKYENSIEQTCDMKLGDTFICKGWQKPEGFCNSTWETLSPFVIALSHGAEDFYNGWMKKICHAFL